MSGYTGEITLTLEELEDIIAVVKGLNADRCTLYRDSGSGIGYTLDCSIATEIEGIAGKFVVPIVDVGQW